VDIPLLLTVVTVLAVAVVLLVVGLALAMRQSGLGRDAAEAMQQSVNRREASLEAREHEVSAAVAELSEARATLARTETELAQRAAQLDQLQAAREQALAAVAGLTLVDAKAEVLAQAAREARLQAAQQAREIEAEAKANAETVARSLITTAVQRMAAEQTSESVVTAVSLPSEEMKGRLIGREGRNIRSFEQITGVNLLIDDNPESVLLSCFDPVRREIARLTLVDLIEDGRIHPARIEEAHERSTERLSQASLRAAEDAVLEMGITDLSPELLPVLGSLQFRTSYGQNVLAHLVECGHIAGLLAAELGLDEATCRRAAFLHDIGKGLSHQEPGSHALAGAALARRAGEHPDIVHAIEAHHNEVEPRTVEAILTQAADAISGSRPGARRESVELYVKRLAKLEELAGSYAGVRKVFAMQAGREIRVMVSPDRVSDAEASAIAKDIAKQVELQLTYPGNIRVTVVRESRATALARRPVNAG
jgi:ribonuclease Y